MYINNSNVRIMSLYNFENKEIDESDFCYIDFTTATDWEVFISELERIVIESQDEVNKEVKNKDSEYCGSWFIKKSVVPYLEGEFSISFFKDTNCLNTISDDDENTAETINLDHDFNTETPLEFTEHALNRWYGLNEFIVVSLKGNQVLAAESQIKSLLSACYVASTNTTVPIFLRIRENWQNLYMGVCEREGKTTHFEMIHLQKGPQHCNYLTGLIDLFKTKIMSPASLDPIIVSLQFSHSLTDFGSLTWKQRKASQLEDNFEEQLGLLPFGVTTDPLESVKLKTTWKNIHDNLVMDSANFSNFDAMQAPMWSLTAYFHETSNSILSDCLHEFIQLRKQGSTLYDILGDFAVLDNEEKNPFEALTESKVPSFSTVLKNAARRSISKATRGTPPLGEDILAPILYYLFPDADTENQHPYTEIDKAGKEFPKDVEDLEEFYVKLAQEFRGYKTCAIDSFVWRLAMICSQILQGFGGIRSMTHVWLEFSQEMRYRWEHGLLISGLQHGFPDPRTCLLHQKLQMLNCCIARKNLRETNRKESSSKQSDDNSSTDDDEFYDAMEESNKRKTQDLPKKQDVFQETEDEDTSKYSLWNQPVGRLGKYENLKLLKTGDPVYIPITQEPVPKTEDQLEEDANVLIRLGSDAQASELRARMMSASLLSDMESFKAANPGAVLDDFIRWYSPRDWIEDKERGLDEWGQVQGCISPRMQIANNPWIDMWASAKPVPAHRQKRLFDDTCEAEKVLHFIESISMQQIYELLFPVLVQAAICRLADECAIINSAVTDAISSLQSLIKLGESLSREGTPLKGRRTAQVVHDMELLEIKLSQTNSLLYKLNPTGGVNKEVSEIVRGLIDGSEMIITGRGASDMGGRMLAMFNEARIRANMMLGGEVTPVTPLSGTGSVAGEIKTLPAATEKEFVMRVCTHKPELYSAKCGQYMRAILSRSEFRLVGAFSEDSVLV